MPIIIDGLDNPKAIQQTGDAIAHLTLRTIPGYPWLPCPICKGSEGCDHTVVERATATRATPFPGGGKIILTSNPG